MRKLFYSLSLIFICFACKDDDINVFEKTADERVAEAIANLKADLVAPAHGWRVKYKPVDETGSYYVLMDFDENNKVTIKTDLSANDGNYFEQTITYRIDNSLGLELILENYSFFSFLFELDDATFGAEYQFNYVNKTPNNELVFKSKTDESDHTLLLFQEAAATDENLLGPVVATNLSEMTQDLNRFTSSLKLTYLNKDIILYVSLDDFKRVIDFNAISKKSNPNISQTLTLSTGYYIEGNSLIPETPLTTTFSGNSISIESISFNTPGEAELNICTDPFTIHTYSGVTSSGDNVLLETTMFDLPGATFAELSDFYFTPLENIRHNKLLVVDSIEAHIAGALAMQLYYGNRQNDGSKLYAIGFVIQNEDNSITYALREFTPVLNQNKIEFNFEPDITLFGNTETDANIDNINIYLDALTEGDNTFVFKYDDDLYEFHNPCTGWSIVFINANDD